MKKNSTKRALLLSALALMMCVAMLIGSTFAWFTDSASTAVNTIQSGTLKVELEMYDEDIKDWVTAEGKTLEWKKAAGAPTNEAVLWEPGCTYKLPKLRVRNAGNLALKYEVVISGFKGDAKLLEAIEFTGLPTDDVLLAGKSNEFEIVGTMDKDAGNEYQNLTIDNIAITIFATQLAHEYDSLGNTYDTDAKFLNKDSEGAYLISNADELVYFALSVNKFGKNYKGETVKLTADIDLSGKKFAPIGQTGATEFKGVFDGQNYTIENMTIVNTDEGKNCASGLFGWIEDHGENIVIKNIKFDNAKVTGNHNVAVVAGYVYGTIENCEVKNSTVIGLNANDDANGDKVGAIAGYAGDARINNNKVENCTISGNRDVGGIIGVIHTGVLSFNNNTIKDSAVTYVTERTYASAGAITSGRTGYVPNATNVATNVSVGIAVSVENATDLQDALNRAEDGDVIHLIDDIEGTLELTQKDLTKVVVDGNGNVFNGSLTIDGQSKAISTAGLTIKNVVFDSTDITYDACIRLGAQGNSKTRYTSNVTIENCTFIGDGEKVAIKSYTGGDRNLTIKNCVATNVHSLLQIKNAANLTIEDCEVTGVRGISIGASSNVKITDVKIDATTYGIRSEGRQVGAAITISDCEIKANIPVVIRQVDTAYAVTFNGTNTFTATNTEGLWCVAAYNEYGDADNNVLTTADLTPVKAEVTITVNDKGLNKNGIFIKK